MTDNPDLIYWETLTTPRQRAQAARMWANHAKAMKKYWRHDGFRSLPKDKREELCKALRPMRENCLYGLIADLCEGYRTGEISKVRFVVMLNSKLRFGRSAFKRAVRRLTEEGIFPVWRDGRWRWPPRKRRGKLQLYGDIYGEVKLMTEWEIRQERAARRAAD